MAVDAIGLLHRIERRAMLAPACARPSRDARVAHQAVEIVPERLGELGLRIEQIHDPQIGRQTGDVWHRRPRARRRGAAASGHSASRQLRKFAAAARIASAVIERMAGGAGFAAPFGVPGPRTPGPRGSTVPVVALGENRERISSPALTPRAAPAATSAADAKPPDGLGQPSGITLPR